MGIYKRKKNMILILAFFPGRWRCRDPRFQLFWSLASFISFFLNITFFLIESMVSFFFLNLSFFLVESVFSLPFFLKSFFYKLPPQREVGCL